MSLRDSCIEAAERYLGFLEANNKGLVEVGVVKKEPLGDSRFSLKLSRRIVEVDSIEIRFCGQIYCQHERGHFRVEAYDDDVPLLIITVVREMRGFDDAAVADIQVVSNLRFLVQRVRDWFSANGWECSLPDATGFQLPDPVLALDEAQLTAYRAALGSPCSYVWGPPGTGKTRYVLTCAALSLAARGERVAIVAPTNLALDLAMSSLIETAEGRSVPGLERRRFLRLGSPTREFSDRFPEVCEERGLLKQIEALTRACENIKNVLRCRKNREVLPQIDAALKDADEVVRLHEERDENLLRHGNLVRAIQSIEASLQTLTSRFFGWLTGTRAAKSAQLAAARDNVESLNLTLNSLEEKIRKLVAALARIETGSASLDPKFAAFARLNMMSPSFRHDVSELSRSIAVFRLNAAEFVEKWKAIAATYDGHSNDSLEAESTRISSQLEGLRAKITDERLRDSLVIGCTLDVFINRFMSDALSVSRIFLDEACYAPLIKALTLFRRNVPVTLLGDHMQLPPVCEMKEQTMAHHEKRVCALWSKSSIFAKFLLHDPMPEIDEWFGAEMPPDENRFPTAILTRTYRFGQNLASILDEFVYGGIGFTSALNSDEPLQIEVVSVPHSRSDGDWQNEAEAREIRRALNGTGGASRGIITPYRKQVSRLSNTLPSHHHDEIMTVHRAQGREWDTIFFSAVDTDQPPYFTDSTIPVGKQVLNTAISRARKRLVLVCDAAFWTNGSNAHQQLLSRLIQAQHR